MNTKGKYQTWGNFLKSRRERRFRSAREFCSQVPVGISYPQYSRYEAGDQLPSLEQAIALCSTLGVASIEALLEWNFAQISPQDVLTRAGVTKLLEDFRGKSSEDVSKAPGWSPQAAERSVPLDDVIVFNRSHLKLFCSDPAYRDIFTYINSFGPNWISDLEIARALELELTRAQEMLEKLSELGVIFYSEGGCRASKRNFYFPDDEDFFGLRNLNIAHNTSSIMANLKHEDLIARRAYRGLITRELTDYQVSILVSGIEQLLGQLIALPETSAPRTIYSMCVLFGERFSRAEPAPAEYDQTKENL